MAESSWAAGATIATESRIVSEIIGNVAPIWSTAPEEPSDAAFFTGDGGDVENLSLMPMLRRSVSRVTAFVNTPNPLNQSWDPYQRAPIGLGDLDDSFAAYFGVFTDPSNERAWNYRMNQVFHTEDFNFVVSELQAGLRSGMGAVAKVILTTVHNPHWGIPGGENVTITWNYLSRCPQWENKLPDELRLLIIPKKGDVNDTSNLVQDGPFPLFPHYSTSVLKYTAEQATLLAALGEWVVMTNRDKFF